jgi:hypothetical protein
MNKWKHAQEVLEATESELSHRSKELKMHFSFTLADIHLLFILSAFLASLISFRKNFLRPLRFFSFILFFSFAIELTGFIYSRILHRHNAHIYNLNFLVIFPFYAFFYSQFFPSHKMKRRILLLTSCYFLFALVNIIFIQGLNTWNSYSLIAGSLLNIYLSVSYFQNLLPNKELIKFQSDPVFWISVGVLIFYLVELPYISLLNYLNSNFLILSKQLLMILKILNMLMYSLFTIAFLCRISLRKY